MFQFHTIFNTSDHKDLASFILFRQGMIMITDSIGIFLKPSLTKVCFNHIPKLCFKTYLNQPINKNKLRKKKPKAIIVLKKEGGGRSGEV